MRQGNFVTLMIALFGFFLSGIQSADAGKTLTNYPFARTLKDCSKNTGVIDNDVLNCLNGIGPIRHAAKPKDCQSRSLSWPELVECANQGAYGKVTDQPIAPPKVHSPNTIQTIPKITQIQPAQESSKEHSQFRTATQQPTALPEYTESPVIQAPKQAQKNTPTKHSKSGLLEILTVAALGVMVYATYGKNNKNHQTKRTYAHRYQEPPITQPKKSPFEESISSTRTDTNQCRKPTERQEKQNTPNVWSRELIQKLEWKRFEDVCVQLYTEIGHRTEATSIGADGGIDFRIFNPETQEIIILGQCKAWSVYKVGVKHVREFYGAMKAHQVAKGIYITSGIYSQDALGFTKSIPTPDSIDLIDGDDMLKLISELPQGRQDALFDFATHDDYTTPTCPNCGIKMVQREATKGKNAGETFWGCRNYPRCKQKLYYNATTA